jgi:hypothetical protein
MSEKKTPAEVTVPEVYTNVAKVNFSQFEIELTCGLVSSNYEGVKPVVNIRMSPQFAKELATILVDNVRKYEENVMKLEPRGIGTPGTGGIN